MAFDDVLYVIFGPNANPNNNGVAHIHGGICSYHAFPDLPPPSFPCCPPEDSVFLLDRVLNNLPFFSFGGSD